MWGVCGKFSRQGESGAEMASDPGLTGALMAAATGYDVAGIGADFGIGPAQTPAGAAGAGAGAGPGAGGAAAIGADAGPAPGGAVDLWPAFLARLAREMRADGLSLSVEGPEGLLERWQHGAAPTLSEPAALAQMRVDRVYSQVDLPGPVTRATGAEPPGGPTGGGPAGGGATGAGATGAGQGGVALRAIRCPLPAVPGGAGLGAGFGGGLPGVAQGAGGQMLVLASRSGSDFRAVDSVLLSGLGRQIAQALALWRALRAERARAVLEARARAALGVGWLVLSPSGRVLAAGPGPTEDLCRRAGLWLRGDGWLGFEDEGGAARLRMALAPALSQPEPVAVECADPALALCLERGGAPGEPALILWLRARPLARALPVAGLARGLGVTPAEARLAACLADGLSLTEAATALGWTIETARSTSKAVYAKLGTSGQTGVALAVQGAALWLAEAARG